MIGAVINLEMRGFGLHIGMESRLAAIELFQKIEDASK